MKKIYLFFGIVLWVFDNPTVAQTENAHLRISIITCAPGDELYSIFGHTAIRIIDSVKGTDFVYNYGTFDFEDPDFNTKFVRGKLDYFLSVSDFSNFMYEYTVTHRSVTEQELLIPNHTKNEIQETILINLSDKNRYYKYDFLYNNCTSRVKDILAKKAGMVFNRKLVITGSSFRDMIHEYLDKAGMSWTKLGMDILLGSPSDKVVSINESMFLPDYLLKGIDSTSLSAGPVLYKKQSLFLGNPFGKIDKTNWPVIIFGMISALFLWISFLQHLFARKLIQFFDSFLLLVTGGIGCLLVFTWLGTDHHSFANNYNLLWALPTNTIAGIALWKKPDWLQKYFLLSAFIYGALLIFWYWLPQPIHPAFIPIVLFLFLRTTQLAKR